MSEINLDETKVVLPYNSDVPPIQPVINILHLPNVKNEKSEIKIKYKGQEFSPQETEKDKEELLEAAEYIATLDPKDQIARDKLDFLIKSYRKKVQNYINGTSKEHDFITRDAHMLFMLVARRDGASLQDLQELANMHFIILRDKNESEHNSWGKAAFAIGTGSIMIVASGVSIGGTLSNDFFALIQKYAANIKDAKDLSKQAQGVIQVSQGVQQVGSWRDTVRQGTITKISAEQQLVNAKDGQFREDARRSASSEDAARQLAAKVSESRNQVILTFVRNNY